MNNDNIRRLINKVLDDDSTSEPDKYDAISDIMADWGVDLMAYESRA